MVIRLFHRIHHCNSWNLCIKKLRLKTNDILFWHFKTKLIMIKLISLFTRLTFNIECIRFFSSTGSKNLTLFAISVQYSGSSILSFQFRGELNRSTTTPIQLRNQKWDLDLMHACEAVQLVGRSIDCAIERLWLAFIWPPLIVRKCYVTEFR